MTDAVNVKVAVRTRPFNQREKDMNAEVCLKVEGDTVFISNPSNGKEEGFTFDHAYWIDSPQESVYNDLGRPILDKALEGYNSTIFAYGQTGAGKTFSMSGNAADEGIIPRLNKELFDRIEEESNAQHQYLITCSFLEIYNEDIQDLLNPSDEELRIRQHPKLGIFVEGLAELVVKSFDDVFSLMSQGNKVRTVAATKMNQSSSRSHSIFTLKISQKIIEGTKERVLSAKLNLVDLAGSERAAATGAEGQTLKEGAMINLSLTSLGNVINALADPKKRKGHIPYRDSKLTRILQESLGGNAVTCMLAALSPASVNLSETYSTILFASRAKNITNQSRKNEDESTRVIRELREEIERLRGMISGGGVAAAPVAMDTGKVAEMENRMKELEDVKSQSWEEQQRMSSMFEEERKRNMAQRGLMDVLQENLQKGNKELMESIARAKDEKSRIEKEFEDKKKEAQKKKEEFEEEVSKFKAAEKDKSFASAEERAEKLSRIETLKRNVLQITEVLKELKNTKHKLEKEDIRAQQALILNEGSEMRKLIEEREKVKIQSENEVFLADMKKKMEQQLKEERDRILLESQKHIADTDLRLMNELLELERQLLDERASRQMLLRQVKNITDQKDVAEDKVFELQKQLRQERESFKLMFEKYKSQAERKHSQDLEHAVRAMLAAQSDTARLQKRVQDLEKMLSEA
eukprot:ANDGO_04515.mRNA.1 Osmotic avoidance abnormal protein 3